MTEQDPFSLSLLFDFAVSPPALWMFASSPARGAGLSPQKVSSVTLFFLILCRCRVAGRGVSRTSDIHSYGLSLLRRCQCILGQASTGLCPGVVSSLDVAHSLIQLGICLFTQGRHKEIRGVRDGERVREELSSHIWVDGTHGESTLEWSAVSPHFSSTLSPAL